MADFANPLPLKLDMDAFVRQVTELGRVAGLEAERVGMDIGKAMAKGLSGGLTAGLRDSGSGGGGAGGGGGGGGGGGRIVGAASSAISALSNIAPSFGPAGGAIGAAASAFSKGGAAGAAMSIASTTIKDFASMSQNADEAGSRAFLHAPSGASPERVEAYRKEAEKQSYLTEETWTRWANDKTDPLFALVGLGTGGREARLKGARDSREAFEAGEGVALSARDRVASKYERLARAGVADKISDERLQEEIAREERRDRGALENRRRIQGLKTAQAGEDPRQHHIGT